MLNNQKPEKKLKHHDGNELDIVHIFPTIQGEGPFSGWPAIFVRLAGCNLQCPWCDTDYTSNRQVMDIKSIKERISELSEGRYPLVVITGGEPFRQNIGILINRLVIEEYFVQIESNGSLPPPNHVNFRRPGQGHHVPGAYIVCSPKSGSINPILQENIYCFKYVLDRENQDPEDGLPTKALEHTCAKNLAKPPVNWKGLIYLQPMDAQEDKNRTEENTRIVLNTCLKHGYIFQLQIHKLVGVD